MELLKAVNVALSYLGEYPIDNIEDSYNDTVELVLTNIDIERKSLITEGWYFNASKLELKPDATGHVPTPQNTLSVLGLNGRYVDYNGYLFDLDSDTLATRTVVARITKDVPFELLPIYAREVILYRATVSVYVADNGVDNTAQGLEMKAQSSYRLLKQEELRNNRYKQGYPTNRTRGINWNTGYRRGL